MTSSVTSSATSSPIKSRRCSSTASSETSLRDLEVEFLSLRDEHLSYEEDAQFHIFIDALDRVDSLLAELPSPQATRRRSLGRLLDGFKIRSKDKTSGSTVELS
ncbi:hypothetical protein FALBO_16126 [Fusarium albosuccineum]|uniref:Uncharacterized protein n=1 Tax=Fusarium albosuccineum TaxID=1237068 RepID=A0A8H4P1P0_9HYPO|nr:hypothetical protein FALBO_16126 [Fusarium albosuccineum]KAF4978687.1 hypothetical protein FDECE_18173 [Fusarium decemcellulare]